MNYTFSLVVNHAPWAVDRNLVLADILARVNWGEVESVWLHQIDYRGGSATPKDKPVLFSVNQWNWSAQQKTTHHVFMTDDLQLAPDFWPILVAMVQAAPDDVIGLLSNHPKAVELAHRGYHWYRTNSWVVGPCYVVPHKAMFDLADWAERRFPEETWDKLGWSDDSELNHWISTRGRKQALHPIPTPIEHMRGPSTWSHTGHGDEYSHERVSWRQPVREFPDCGYRSDGELLAKCETNDWWMARGGPQESPMLGLP